MEFFEKPISYYNKEFERRFGQYRHPFTRKPIETAQEYLFALKSQRAGDLVAPDHSLSIEELNLAFRDEFKNYMPPDGLPIENMDDYLRELDIQMAMDVYGERGVAEDADEEHNLDGYNQNSSSDVDEVNPIEELNSMIGIYSVKREVKALINFLKVQSFREEQGLPQMPTSLHLVFSGNPGTGKTSVARIIARIYKEIGALSTGQLVEVDRSGLVSGYVGQTAIKTQQVIDSAIGGVLFIDEAYTLYKEGNDFGQEAIDTLLKAMEDHRKDLAVIVAGYPNEIRAFINSNPGLSSRFKKFIEFPDYDDEELEKIFYSFCEKYDYVLDDKASSYVRRYCESLLKNKGNNFANARVIRNVFEDVISNQSSRLLKENTVSREDLRTITIEDLTNKIVFI